MNNKTSQYLFNQNSVTGYTCDFFYKYSGDSKCLYLIKTKSKMSHYCFVTKQHLFLPFTNPFVMQWQHEINYTNDYIVRGSDGKSLRRQCWGKKTWKCKIRTIMICLFLLLLYLRDLSFLQLVGWRFWGTAMWAGYGGYFLSVSEWS